MLAKGTYPAYVRRDLMSCVSALRFAARQFSLTMLIS